MAQMSNEKVAGIWERPGIIISIAAGLVVAFAVICAVLFHGAEKRLAEEHARAEKWEEQAVNVAHENDQLRENLSGAVEAAGRCTVAQLQSMTDSAARLKESVDRLKTRTLLAARKAAGRPGSLFPAMQRAGLLGLLMDVV
jgi:hypothetical protein